MAMDFPGPPLTVGQLYPPVPVPGIPQYKWDGTAWVAVLATEMQNYVQRIGDTMTGSLTMAAPAMVTLSADPTAIMHAATKQYVDGGVGGVGGGLLAKVDKAGGAGGIMTGLLTLSGDPTAALHAATKQYVDAHPAANLIINGDFRVNQVGYVSAAALTAPAYGHDQWKAGASGGDYSFTQLKSSTQITIASGKSIIQPIEDANVAGGSYVLTWTGTAQARAGVNTLTPSGAYAASPLAITGQTAGTVMSVEFNSGTLGTVKLESGTNASAFVMRPYDQELMTCMRYYEKSTGRPLTWTGSSVASFAYLVSNDFKVCKRAVPTMSFPAANSGGALGGITSPSTTIYAVSIETVANATQPYAYLYSDWIADARL